METIMHSFFGLAGKSLVASSRHAALIAALLASALALAAPAHAQQCNGCGPELGNGWYSPVPNATGFEFDFAGDQTGVIPQQVQGDTTTNAFAVLGASTITVTYDIPAQLTRVIFSGLALPDPVPNGWKGPDHACVVGGPGTYHFGLNGGWQAANQNAGYFSRLPMSSPVAAYWITNQGPSSVQTLTASWVGKFSKKNALRWAAVYTQTTECAGMWQMVAYSPPAGGKALEIKLTNGGTAPITIGTTGYELGFSPPNDPACRKSPQCPANQAVLDSLNDEGFPIPGAPGSKFIPVKTPKKVIQPGQSFTFEAK
jgi:hypothetical protein